jgi:glutamate dehydrogenase
MYLILFGSQGFIPRELVTNEVNWFYSHLGIDDTYFQNESPSVISDHIIALFGAKVLAFTKHDPSKLVIDLENIDEKGNGATFIHTSPPGLTSTEGPGATCESRYFCILYALELMPIAEHSGSTLCTSTSPPL